MKVSIRKSEKTVGMLRKTTEYELWVKVDLTPEEVGAIKKAGIDHYVLMEYTYGRTELNWTVAGLLYSNEKGSEGRFVALDAIERNKMEQTVKDQLSALKSQIDGQLSSGGTETFEL